MELPDYQGIEPIHESSTSLVCRARRAADDRPVILKCLRSAHLTAEGRARVKREYEVGRSLNPGDDPAGRVTGVVETLALTTGAEHWIIVQEDFGGEALGQGRLASRLSLLDKLHVALEATRTLGQLHRRRVVHNDLNPHHIVYNPETKEVKLIDFGISFVTAEASAAVRTATSPEGTLPYSAPEQTGRINRGVDYRADYYSLGVTLYELFAGRLPFETKDPLELVHAHLARQPIPPHEINPALPLALSRILLRLMAKNPEDRYQSAWGLEADLREVRERLAEGRTLDDFVPGAHDVSSRFQIPTKLYGREREVQALVAALGRVSRGGPSEVVLISGYAGIGKSTLVQEIRRPAREPQGPFAAGKFEELRQRIPYSGISQAFAGLLDQILSEGEVERAAWKAVVAAALGPNGRLLTELYPDLEVLIGAQPELPLLGPSEAENRFQLTVLGFVSAFCRVGKPLTLFLDDLQWADVASLRLLESLPSACGHSLLLLGAYRDADVDEAHPLSLSLARLERDGTPVARLAVAPLSPEHVGEMLCDTLRSPPEAVAPLTQLILAKTGGNPFFITQFLWALHAERLLFFSEDEQRWAWDIDRIRRKDITDNVVDLLLGRLSRLPAAAQEALRLAACVGNRFELRTLALVQQRAAGDTHATLQPAVDDGLLVVTSPEEPIAFRFAHDRVQQVAHALLDPDERRQVRLRIGRLMLAAAREDELGERVFEIVDHFNAGAAFIASPEEREAAARLDLDAAARAREATAYQAARDYAQTGLDLCALTRHPRPPETPEAALLRFSLKRELAQAEDLMGAHERSEPLYRELLEEADQVLPKVEIYSLLIRQYTLTGRYEQAIDAGRRALGLLGIELPDRDLEAAFAREAAAIRAALAGVPIRSLLDRPEATAPEHRSAMRVLTSLNAAGMYTDRRLYNLIVAMKVRLGLAHGHTPESAFAYVSFGVPLSSSGEDLRGAYELGMMARDLSMQSGRPDLRCKIDFILGTYILPWNQHLSQLDRVYDEGYRAGLSGGDLLFAGNILAFRLLVPFWSGRRLGDLLEDAPRFLAFEEKTKTRIGIDRVLACYLPLLDLTGRTDHRGSFSPTAGSEHAAVVPDEAALLASFEQHRSTIAVAVYQITKAQLLYLYGDVEAALALLDATEPLLPFVSGTMSVVEHRFYTGMAAAALHASIREESLLLRLRAATAQMERWADHCPQNFAHKHLLLSAEAARAEGRLWEAMTLYERAIADAGEREFAHVEALACERLASLWIDQRKEEFARGYVQRAYFGYQAWGAVRKTEQMEERLGHLLTAAQTRGLSVRSTTGPFDEALDLATVLKASQAIAGEIVLRSLADKLVDLVIQNAGAQRGCLLLEQEGAFRVVAEAKAAPDVEPLVDLPSSVIHFVSQRQSDVVLRDAVHDPQFGRDPVIRARHPRSVLATPIVKQGRVMGILYLENNLVAGAFTPGRLSMLHMLSAQIAISLENALLYAELEDRVRARTQELSAKNDELREALHRLGETQQQLVQREKLASLGALTAGIAHELRNPLNFINNFATLSVELMEELELDLRDVVRRDSPAAEAFASVKDNLTKINHHGQRADRIIGGMLMHSRARSLAHAAVDINKILAESAYLSHQSFRARRPGSRVELVTDYDPRVAPIDADAGDLQRVFLNLLDNALYAAVRKEAPGHEARVSVTTRELDSAVEIRVRDNGAGVPEAHAAKLFTPFFTTKSPGEGVGLGLSICHDIVVRGHRGTIRAESVEGSHTELVVTLPRR